MEKVYQVSFVQPWGSECEAMQGIPNWECFNLGSTTDLLTMGKPLYLSEALISSSVHEGVCVKLPLNSLPALASTVNSSLYR